MPEGDTIFRAAASLRRWLVGREVTAASTQVPGLPAHRLVGDTVDAVDTKGKHLLIRFRSGRVLHTHMRMTGSWHVYSAGEPWRKPHGQARMIVETGERLAVCFNAPVIELLALDGERRHPALVALGPDVLAPDLDLIEIRRRVGERPANTPAGDLLLDQRVVCGIGNIYRCETLFLNRVHPATPLAALDVATLDGLFTTAARLMRGNATAGSSPMRQFGASGQQTWVYGRGGRPCARCGRSIRCARLGLQARSTYWCPHCQPEASLPGTAGAGD